MPPQTCSRRATAPCSGIYWSRSWGASCSSVEPLHSCLLPVKLHKPSARSADGEVPCRSRGPALNCSPPCHAAIVGARPPALKASKVTFPAKQPEVGNGTSSQQTPALPAWLAAYPQVSDFPRLAIPSRPCAEARRGMLPGFNLRGCVTVVSSLTPWETCWGTDRSTAVRRAVVGYRVAIS